MLSVLLLSTQADTAVPDTLITTAMCDSGYYNSSADNCAAVKTAVAANHSTSLPILTLGNAKDPVMLFIHGWPDSAALWVNQFEAFCLPGAALPHYCVAVTWTNCHPDLPTVTDPNLLWPDKVLNKIEATVDELKLKDITLVIHDWGSMFGYQLAAKRPSLIKRIISFDIGNIGTTRTGFKEFCYT